MLSFWIFLPKYQSNFFQKIVNILLTLIQLKVEKFLIIILQIYMQVYLKPDRRKTQLIPDGCFSYRNLPSAKLTQQQHISDYYALTDRHFKTSTKNTKRRTKTKSKAKKKSKSKTKSEKCITIGSALDHSKSLQKLQAYLNTLNKQKIDQIQEKQKVQNEVTFLTRKIMSPRNQAEEKYIQELEQKERVVEELNFLHYDQDIRHKEQLKRLKKKLRQLEKQKQQIDRKAEEQKKNKGPKKINRICAQIASKSRIKNKTKSKSKSKSKNKVIKLPRSSAKI